MGPGPMRLVAGPSVMTVSAVSLGKSRIDSHLEKSVIIVSTARPLCTRILGLKTTRNMLSDRTVDD